MNITSGISARLSQIVRKHKITAQSLSIGQTDFGLWLDKYPPRNLGALQSLCRFHHVNLNNLLEDQKHFGERFKQIVLTSNIRPGSISISEVEFECWKLGSMPASFQVLSKLREFHDVNLNWLITGRD